MLQDIYRADNSKLLKEVLENAYDWMVVTDPDGYIIFMTKAYQAFCGFHDAVGMHVTEVIENTRMHIVAKTGKAEMAAVQRIKGHDMICNRIPMFNRRKLIAVLGTVTFKDVRELRALAAAIDRPKQEMDYDKEDLQRKLLATYGLDEIIGVSASIQSIKDLAKRVAQTDTTVLITGESGTGKELFAHAIHAASRRQQGPLVCVNCAAIPETLLESELFGYEEGAFTGALRHGKKGKFELADGGTILLDEIGDMPLLLQSKLLRVLQEREIERIGGTLPISIDVRVISSTNRNLRELIRAGRFREDLFYRLNVLTIQIPPLRDRLEDIPHLVAVLLDDLRKSTGISVRHVDDDVYQALQSYTWPGNVRELRNVLERALHFMDGNCLKAEHLSIQSAISSHEDSRLGVRTLREAVESAEKDAIFQALSAAGGDRRLAAKMLDISRSSLYQKLKSYGIDE